MNLQDLPVEKNHAGRIFLRKTLLIIMRLSFVLFTVAALQAQANGMAQRVSVYAKNTELKNVLKKIEKQTGYFFWYEDKLLRDIPPITVNIQNEELRTALDLCFKNVPLTYEIFNKTILLSARSDASLTAIAANKIKGRVTDPSGKPITGASVQVQGAAAGVATNSEGQFSIEAGVGDVLVISSVGYQVKQVTITNVSQELIVTLEIEQKQIAEVIVTTALGIKRAEKSLTYNVQQVSGEELTRNKDASFVNSLVGKIAGVTINASSAGIGGATRVIMRGTKSISGNNNALYVIDGIPVLNSTGISSFAPGGKISDIYSGNTGSDLISSINPEDIESISTLTGAAAAALYGSQAQNGVIIINTKSGKNDKSDKAVLGLFNNTMFFSPLVMPQFQNTYGPSEEGSFYSWGPKLKTPSSYRPESFFQRGNNTTTGLNFSSGTETNQTFVSGSILTANGIIPNNTVNRYNFSARNTTKILKDKLTLDVNTMYISQTEKNMVAQGLYHNPLVPVYLFPPGGNIEEFKVYERYNADRLFPTQYWPYLGDQFRTENPWWIINREPVENTSKRLLMGASLKYNLLSWLNITARGRFDQIDYGNTIKRYASTDQLFAGYGGYFYRSSGKTQSLYGDVIANINKTIGNYTISANIGAQRTESMSQSLSAGGSIAKGSPPNVFTTANVSGSTGAGAGSGTAGQPNRTSFQSVFATANISYKNMFFIDGTFRSDWYSQLYFNNDSKLYITYPSIGASAIVSDIFQIQSNALSYVKLRANYALAGNPPTSYAGGPQVFLVSAGAISQNSPLHLPLFPERTKAWEVGANFKFLRNKINLDVTLYNTDTYNQIFSVSQSASSGGYGSFLINAGQVNNRGIEAGLGYRGDVGVIRWESNATFTLNKNIAKKLFSTTNAKGKVTTVDTITVAGGGSYQQKVAVGGNLSAIYTTSQLFLDQNGYVNIPLSIDERSYVYAGNADPKYTMGWNNRFSYKNISVSFLIFARVGGVGVSATQAMLDAYGVSKTTADARDLGYVTVNGQPYPNVAQYYTLMGSGLNGVLGYYVYDATNVRLREVSVGYTIPGKVFRNIIKSLSVSVTGNNLFMFYNKAPFDPESTASSGTYYQGFDYFRQPSLRGIGFSINAKF